MPLESRLAPAIATWDGGGTNNFWTTAANWVGDVAPQINDDLVFPTGATGLTNVNDFAAGTAFNSLAVTGGGYLISGNDVTLTAGVSFNFSDVNNASTLSLNIGGTGGLNKAGFGLLILSGDNTYSGVTNVTSGILEVRSNNGLGAAGAGNETVVSSATSANLRFAGAGLLIPEAMSFSTNTELTIQPHSSVTLESLVTLTGSGTRATEFSVSSFSDLTFAQGIVETGGAHDLEIFGDGFLTGAKSHLEFRAGSVKSVAGNTLVAGFSGVTFNGTSASGTFTFSNTSIAGAANFGATTILNSVGFFGAPIAGLNVNVGNFNVPFSAGVPTAAGHVGFLVNEVSSYKYTVTGTVQLGGYAQVSVLTGIVGHWPPPTILMLGHRYRIIDNDGTDAVVGTFAGLPEGSVACTFGGKSLRITYHGGTGNDVELFVDPGRPALAVGSDAGQSPVVKVYDGNRNLLTTFDAYGSAFRGGVRVATGDITGDGVLDIITAAGAGGGPHIRVFDGVTFAVVREFFAYSPNFFGGVFVAAGDVNGDGRADIITGAGAGGGPHVQAFSGTNNSVVASFMAYDLAFTGGVTVAVFNSQIVTGPGPGGGPHVKLFGTNGIVTREFFAFDPNFRGGVFVGSTFDTTGQMASNLIVAAGATGGPHVKAYVLGGFPHIDLLLNTEFFAYGASFTGGVRVTGADLDGDGRDEIVTGAGPGGGPHVRSWRLNPFFGGPITEDGGFFAFDPAFTGGVFVG